MYDWKDALSELPTAQHFNWIALPIARERRQTHPSFARALHEEALVRGYAYVGGKADGHYYDPLETPLTGAEYKAMLDDWGKRDLRKNLPMRATRVRGVDAGFDRHGRIIVIVDYRTEHTTRWMVNGKERDYLGMYAPLAKTPQAARKMLDELLAKSVPFTGDGWLDRKVNLEEVG